MIKDNKKRLVLSLLSLFIFLVFTFSLVSASFGFDNPNLPKVTREPPTVITFNNNTGAVNTSDYWDGLDTPNDISIFLLNTGDTATGNYTFDSGTLFIDSSSNRVGIGTLIPENKIHVVDSSVVGTFERSTAATNTLLTALNLKHTTSADMVDGFGATFNFAIEDVTGVNNYIASFGAVRDGADNSGALVFNTRSVGSDSEHMRIRSNGKVGIGTNNPLQQLEIKSDNAAVAVSSEDSPNIVFFGRIATSGAGIDYGKMQLKGSGGTNVIIKGEGDSYILGNVGIGTSSPDSAFHIKADIAGSVGSHSAGQLIIQNPTDSVTSNAVITGYESDGSGNPDQQLWYLGSSSGSNSNIIFLNRRNALLQFGTNGNIQMTILGNGDVGIGIVSSLLAKLHVLGNVFFDGNLNVTGNVTAENVFLPTFLFAHTNDTIPVASAGVWYNVTYGEEVSSPKLRITHTHDDNTNDTFIIQDDGYYNIHYAMSFQDATATPSAHILMRVIKNDVEIPGTLLEEDSSKQYADFTVSNGPIVYLVTGDEIKFQFTSDDTDVSLTSHRTYGVHHDTSVIKIIKISN